MTTESTGSREQPDSSSNPHSDSKKTEEEPDHVPASGDDPVVVSYYNK